EGCAVLIRALEPVDGISEMREIRCKSSKKKQKDSDLTGGPSKLCQALQINKTICNKIDLTASDQLWLERGIDIPPDRIVHCPRINIGYAEDSSSSSGSSSSRPSTLSSSSSTSSRLVVVFVVVVVVAVRVVAAIHVVVVVVEVVVVVVVVVLVVVVVVQQQQ
ncbi:DNA-3-methyladenine glycosylase, partial [Elysia marginata]